MKKILLVLFVLFSGTSLFAQIRKIPSAVTDALKQKYPEAQNVAWKDKVTYFEAQFTMGGAEMTADFSNKGEWQETEKKITYDALPEEVKDGFKKSKFSDWTPGTVTILIKNDRDTLYKMYVEKSSLVQKKFLYFKTDGQLDHDAPGI